MTLELRVNGRKRTVDSEADTPLVFVLRDEFKLKGTKLGCGLEQCGACAVLVDGEPVMSCISPVSDFVGREIVTVEGIGATATGRRVQNAFIEASAAQCGYCTSGLVIAVTGLLGKMPKPDLATAKAALAPYLCRCGSHPRVIRAVALASDQV